MAPTDFLGPVDSRSARANTMPETATATIDDSACASEPIHMPGAIQPHGYLLIVDAADQTVVAVSQNMADAMELSVSDMTGRPVSDFLMSATEEALDDIIGRTDGRLSPRVVMRHPCRTDELDVFVRMDDDVILLELEPSTSAEWASKLFGEVRTAIERIRLSANTESTCKALAAGIRRLSGFDRVMVYCFDEDWNGQVVAEDRLDSVPSYLRHAFPASDIPPQARALYLLNTVRIIPDSRYRPSPILPRLHPSSGRPFDLSLVTLRSVSPVHLEYMANMGVAASMSVSIIRDGQLWGLVACHHGRSHILPQSVLQSCDLLCQTAAWYLDSNERAVAEQSLAAVRRLETVMERDDQPDFRDRLAAIVASLLGITSADGLAIWEPHRAWAVGLHPPVSELSGLAEWLSATGQDRVTTDRLSRIYPPAAEYMSNASGMVAARLGAAWVIWFRAEWAHSLTWAGRTDEPHHLDPETGRISPRKSFASWRQEVRGRSAPWTTAALAAVEEVQALILRGMLTDQMRQLTESEKALTAAKLFAEAANRAKGEFLANMTHEVRTPLTAIVGFADLIRDVEGLPPTAAKYVDRVITAGRTLASVVNDILDFSKIEAGQLDIDNHTFDPAAVIVETLDLAGAQAERKGLTLSYDNREDLPAAACADSSRIRQVLLNLIGNAIKFTAQGGVTVSARYLSDPPARLKVTVTDTGIGIPADKIHLLFQRFSQVDSSICRAYGGTGLGLAICKSLTELMGGEIGVCSIEGEGSTFWFTIPDATAEIEAPDNAATLSGRDCAAARILIVDDVAANRELVSVMLSTCGHTLTEATNAKEAIAAALREPFDLILMDLQMPGMDGLAATQAIRARSELNRDTPIIGLSANTLGSKIAECVEAGMNDYIAKPIDRAAFMAKVATWTSTERAQ